MCLFKRNIGLFKKRFGFAKISYYIPTTGLLEKVEIKKGDKVTGLPHI